MSQSSEQHLRINRATPSLEYPSDRNHSNNAILAHEAVFQKTPFAVPTDQARVNFEGLKYCEVTTKLGGRIADDRKRLVLSGNSQNTSTDKLVHATNVGERKISTIVDMQIEVQIVWPYP